VEGRSVYCYGEDMDDYCLLPPGVVDAALGDCDLIELLGTGRFGETFRVIKGGEEYAVKLCHFLPVMPDHLWERELGALQRVAHPNVVGFRAAGVLDHGGKRYPYMECEYVPGGDLQQRIEAGIRPDAAALRALIVGLLRGVRELHDLGIVHRDIRPRNIALRDGDWAQPVLLDFGLATAFHLSPAHQRLPLSTRRTDVAAVAAVVYETATGQDPAADRHASRRRLSLTRRAQRSAASLESTASPLDGDVGELVRRLLSRRGRRLGADDALRALGED
jgi:serine/threonine protein kinase